MESYRTRKVEDLLFFLPFYAYGELGDVVRSSLGARGEQGGGARGAVTENHHKIEESLCGEVPHKDFSILQTVLLPEPPACQQS